MGLKKPSIDYMERKSVKWSHHTFQDQTSDFKHPTPFIFKQGETDMGDKGKKDKGKKEVQKKAQHNLKEKRKLRKEKKK